VLFSCFCPKNHERWTLGEKQIHNMKKKGSFMKKNLKMKCKQINPRLLTNVATSGDIMHAYFEWFLKWIKERFYFESVRNWSLYTIRYSFKISSNLKTFDIF
jgi:hypothetical protein